MLNATLTPDAARLLHQGAFSLSRKAIARLDGTPAVGEPVRLLDEEGHLLGVGDVDLEADEAVRLLGRPEEVPFEGLIPRHLRRAIERRGSWVEDPRYCRVVHEAGDGLPGLSIDRFGQHYLLRTSTRAMEARISDLARALTEVTGSSSTLARSSSARRSRVIFGTPPRWTRVTEMGARFSVDLYGGPETDFRYHHRELRKAIGGLASGARVLDPACGLGGLLVHAGLHGARGMLAVAQTQEQRELALENVEANGLLGRAEVELGNPQDALRSLRLSFDLLLLDLSLALSSDATAESVKELLRRGVQALRHGGKLVVAGEVPPFRPGQLPGLLAQVCEEEERLPVQLFKASMPPDFPIPLREAKTEPLDARVVEIE